MGLLELVEAHPDVLHSQGHAVLTSVAASLSDIESNSVRKAARSVLADIMARVPPVRATSFPLFDDCLMFSLPSFHSIPFNWRLCRVRSLRLYHLSSRTSVQP